MVKHIHLSSYPISAADYELSIPIMVDVLSQKTEGASDILGLNWLVEYDTPYNIKETTATFGVKLIPAEEFLKQKASLPA